MDDPLVVALQCFVHDSTEPATERSATTMLSMQREVMVQVLPTIRNATPALRSVRPLRRRCLFDDEYSLYPRAPGYDNCLLSCEADRIWRMCGCRPITLPRLSKAKGQSWSVLVSPGQSWPRAYWTGYGQREASCRVGARGRRARVCVCVQDS